MDTSDNFVFFWKLGQENEEFSNFFPCTFKVEGIEYNCVEQYMMAKKALLFKDTDIYSKIIASSNPDEIKAYGKLVKNFDSSVWDDCKREIVFAGNYAKYDQNLYLLIKLLNTGDAILAEASPYDKIWGIGLDKEDPLAKKPGRWKGENLLGGILEDIRDKLQYKVFELETSNESEELFWYETEDDKQVLVTESGKRYICDETSEYFNHTEQEQAGWQRARLFVDWYGIWDVTAFAAGINATMAYGPFMDRSEQDFYLLTFSSPSEAERTVYPFIDADQQALIRENVDTFYASKKLQKKWFSLILRPICLRIYQDGRVIATPINNYNPDEVLTYGGCPVHIDDIKSIALAFANDNVIGKKKTNKWSYGITEDFDLYRDAEGVSMQRYDKRREEWVDDNRMCIVMTDHIKSSSIRKKDAMAIIALSKSEGISIAKATAQLLPDIADKYRPYYSKEEI